MLVNNAGLVIPAATEELSMENRDRIMADLTDRFRVRSAPPKKTKPGGIQPGFVFFGGADRTRTGVQGFADLCLTTRPPRQINHNQRINLQSNRLPL